MLFAALPVEAANDDLREQIETIKNSIAPFPRNFENDPELKKALDALTRAVVDVNCDALSDPIDCYAKRVLGAADQLQKMASKSLPDDDTAAVLKAINALIDILANDPATKKTDVNDAATLVAKLLKARLDTPGVDPANNKDLNDALSKLVPQKDSFRINILQAYYGDLRSAAERLDRDYDSKLSVAPYLHRADTDRVCSATRSMQAYCQGKQACWGVLDGTPGRTGVNLCGYEPAPYANPINKGLAVQYQCVAVSKLHLYEDPHEIDPTTLLPKVPLNPKDGVSGVRIIQFRLGETAQIICSEPPAEKSGSAK